MEPLYKGGFTKLLGFHEAPIQRVLFKEAPRDFTKPLYRGNFVNIYVEGPL